MTIATGTARWGRLVQEVRPELGLDEDDHRRPQVIERAPLHRGKVQREERRRLRHRAGRGSWRASGGVTAETASGCAGTAAADLPVRALRPCGLHPPTLRESRPPPAGREGQAARQSLVPLEVRLGASARPGPEDQRARRAPGATRRCRAFARRVEVIIRDASTLTGTDPYSAPARREEVCPSCLEEGSASAWSTSSSRSSRSSRSPRWARSRIDVDRRQPRGPQDLTAGIPAPARLHDLARARRVRRRPARAADAGIALWPRSREAQTRWRTKRSVRSSTKLSTSASSI